MADDKLKYIQERVDLVVDKVHELNTSVEKQTVAFEAHVAQEAVVHEEQKRMNSILQDNTSSLKDHIHRTDLLETFMKHQDTRFSPIEAEYLRKKAVSTFVTAKLRLAAKVGAVITAATGLLLLAKNIAHLLGH